MKKTVLITGSSSGIGEATAHYFSEKGWNVVATMRNPGKRKTSLHNVKDIDIFHLDVTDQISIKKAVDYTMKKYKRIDALVNNAGFALFGPFETSTKEQVKMQFDTNVIGLLDLTREVIPIMRRQKEGTIINVSSVGGRAGFPAYSLYNATKFAVEGFSECLQYELKDFGIRVKIIEPGPIKTDFSGRSMVFLEKKEYDRFMKKMKTISKKSHEFGSDPRVVAKTIYKAATTKRWRLRYPSGIGAGTMMKMKKLLPERLVFWILRKAVID